MEVWWTLAVEVSVEGGVGRGGQEVSPEGQTSGERRCGGEWERGSVWWWVEEVTIRK